MNQLWEQISTIWGNMSLGQRWTVGAILAVVVAGFIWVIASQAGTQWKTVAKGLTPEDVQAGVTSLDARNIPVRLQNEGDLQVPAERYDEARVELATQTAASGTVGMELFNESTFGQSAFQEAVNYHRALEGELSRTIRSIDGIEGARVHLVIPKKRLFKKDQKSPTASVKLTLDRGVILNKRQLKGIRYLVSSAIEGLKSDQVAIVDQTGNMLARPRDPDDEGGIDMEKHNEFYKLQARYESKMEASLIELLEPLAGEGKVKAQVTLDMDFSQVEITEKNLDPEKQVLVSEERSEEASQSADPAKAGVPGVASNIPGRVTPIAGRTASNRTAKKESLRYETANSIRRTQLPVGRLQRVSVAVAIDGRIVEDADGKSTWEPRTEDEMKQFRDLVAKAVGYSDKRGDQLAVVTTRFELSTPPAPIEPPGPSPWMREGIKWGSIFLLVLLLALGVVRPLVRAAAATTTAMVHASGPPLTAAELEAREDPVSAGALPEPEELSDEGAPSGERLRLRAVDSTRDNPERAAQIIRAWLLVEE